MTNPKSTEFYLVRLMMIGSSLIIAFFGIGLIANIYRANLTEKLSASAREMEASFRTQIASETDAYQAARMGTIFLKTQKDDLALAAFQKATSLDPNFRDGWVWLGYTELKLNQPEEALKSLKKAEELDPINARTYELLAIAYKQNSDEDSAKKAEEKFEYLSKTNKQ